MSKIIDDIINAVKMLIFIPVFLVSVIINGILATIIGAIIAGGTYVWKK